MRTMGTWRSTDTGAAPPPFSFALWSGSLPHGAGRALGGAYLDDWSDPFKAQCEFDRALDVVEAHIQRGRA